MQFKSYRRINSNMFHKRNWLVKLSIPTPIVMLFLRSSMQIYCWNRNSFKSYFNKRIFWSDASGGSSFPLWIYNVFTAWIEAYERMHICAFQCPFVFRISLEKIYVLSTRHVLICVRVFNTQAMPSHVRNIVSWSIHYENVAYTKTFK